MRNYDKTAVDLDRGNGGVEHEFSVEEVARIQGERPIVSETGEIQPVDEQEVTVRKRPVTTVRAAPEVPAPTVPALRRAVAGRYGVKTGLWQIELRIDVDGRRPTLKASGDFYRTMGATTNYFGSFIVEAPTVSITPAAIVVNGIGTFTFDTIYTSVQITIPRSTTSGMPVSATIQFFTLNNMPGATYICQFQSTNFRTVQFERDCEQGVMTLYSYDTGSLPSGGSARTLSIASVFAETGIELQSAGLTNIIPTFEGKTETKWSNAELHDSMMKRFNLWKDVPQWKVWLLAAMEHELGPGVYGIMFDLVGRQRQGCAVFHNVIGGTSPDKLRLQLYTYIHELGHCFNLPNSWQKSLATPASPNRPSAPSWMNDPWYYPGGQAAFWSTFPFQFDNQEIIHLRHAFRNNLITGGNTFTASATLENGEAFTNPVENNTGLQLELEALRSFSYGEPVVVELKLRTTTTTERRVHPHLHPNMGFTQIAIRKPSGTIVEYRPTIDYFMDGETIELDVDRPAIYDSAYIGFGKDGFYFDEIGHYQICALYNAIDGSQIVSKVLKVRVRNPLNDTDEEVADLLFGEEQGMLLYLLGSDSDTLRRGNMAFDQILDLHGNHPLAVYARLVKGINAGREFKTIREPGRKPEVRRPLTEKSIRLLNTVIDASESGVGVDNITLNMTMRQLANIQKAAGDDIGAQDTLKRMVSIFRNKGLKPHVIKDIETQAAET